MSRTVEQMIADYACPETFSDGEGRKWECLGPRDHPGECWPSQTEGHRHQTTATTEACRHDQGPQRTGAAMSDTLAAFDRDRKRARDARREAVNLRELHGIATCGLGMVYAHHHRHESENWINYGTYRVPPSTALRVADQYLVWAAEYDVIAERIEAELGLAIALRGSGDPS